MLINIGKMFSNRALLTPDWEAYVGVNYRFTFKETNLRVNRFAAYLKKNGISKGDRVAVLCKNNEHVTTSMLGAMKMGAIFVPLNYRLKAPELVYILNNCGASLLVYDNEFGAIVDAIREKISVRLFIRALGTGGDASYENILLSMTPDEPEINGWNDDPAVILYTSGTTGNPKGAILTHNNFFWASFGLIHSINWFARYRFLSIAPLFHSGGLAPMIGNMHAGVTTVFMTDFDPIKVWNTIQIEKKFYDVSACNAEFHAPGTRH